MAHVLGKYQECEGLYESVLTLKGKLFGTNHPEYALTLNDMGGNLEFKRLAIVFVI